MREEMNVRHVAQLARLELTPEEEERIAGEMKSILRLARMLQTLEIEDVPQTQHLQGLENVFREDVVAPGLAQEAVLEAAPACQDVYISVPRTVG